jgi:hypothetical protein
MGSSLHLLIERGEDRESDQRGRAFPLAVPRSRSRAHLEGLLYPHRIGKDALQPAVSKMKAELGDRNATSMYLHLVQSDLYR